LASAEFSKEVTSSVLWLNERDLDIRCVRLKPYLDGERVLVDVQQVIPLPETEAFQIQIKEKLKEERSRKSGGRDLGRFDVVVGDRNIENLPKRRTIFEVIKYLCEQGASPVDIQAYVSFKPSLFHCIEKDLTGSDFRNLSTEKFIAAGKKSNRINTRYFSNDEQLIHSNGNTYALTKMWGITTEKALDVLKQKYPNIKFEWKRQN
jgi:hypothetical protein